jgi:hypothetical protein
MTSNKKVDCNDLLDNEYCPYDRVSIWSDQNELLAKLTKKKTRSSHFALLYNLRRQIVWINFCLRWLEKVAKPDGWQMYDHDIEELLHERKALINAFYTLDPDAYLQFLTVAPETKDFKYWDPLNQN